MSGMESDEFNVVGLVRSPVKRTPETGYYAGERHGTNTTGEPLSAATTERMSIGSSITSTDSRRRRALYPVPANTLDTSKASRTPSSLALLSSSISSKKSASRAALSARRSETLPVPRTLSLSPAEAPRPDPTMISDRADCTRNCSGSNSESHYLRNVGRYSPTQSTCAPLVPENSSHTPSPQQQQQEQQEQQQQPWSSNTPHGPPGTRTPTTAPYASSHGSTGGSAARHPLSTPAMADLYPSSSHAAVEEKSYVDNDDGEWSDGSFAGAVFSPDGSDTSGIGGGISSSSRGWRGREGDNEMKGLTAASPISNIYSVSTGSALRGIGGATPRCAGLQASPFPEGTMNRFGESTPAASLALLQLGGSSVAPESAINSSRANSKASLCAARDCPTPAAEREDEELPNTPAAAATLAAMMIGGGGGAVASNSLCGTVVREERSFHEQEAEVEEEEEEGSLISQGLSEGSANAQVHNMRACGSRILELKFSFREIRCGVC